MQYTKWWTQQKHYIVVLSTFQYSEFNFQLPHVCSYLIFSSFTDFSKGCWQWRPKNQKRLRARVSQLPYLPTQPTSEPSVPQHIAQTLILKGYHHKWNSWVPISSLSMRLQSRSRIQNYFNTRQTSSQVHHHSCPPLENPPGLCHNSWLKHSFP